MDFLCCRCDRCPALDGPPKDAGHGSCSSSGSETEGDPVVLLPGLGRPNKRKHDGTIDCYARCGMTAAQSGQYDAPGRMAVLNGL